ncbi:hypothetical protein J2848_004348 [Azospirillum lipoferum]|nr:hypothetical protein [Azospirillum lipoferum]
MTNRRAALSPVALTFQTLMIVCNDRPDVRERSDKDEGSGHE